VQPGTNRGSNLSAGARFTTGFPSKCFTCNIVNVTNGPPGSNPVNNGPSLTCNGQNPNITMNDILLAKKNYIFSNNKNNVISGQLSGANGLIVNNGGGGMTKKQIWARASRGYAPSGMPAKQYGLQNLQITTPNLYNSSGSNQQPTIRTTSNRPFIKACNFNS